MSENHEPLRAEDYAEPRCLLCEPPYGAAPEAKPVPQQRIVQKLDEYMARRDFAGAERHLLYWLEEAKLGGDRRGELLIRNELVGFFRKTGKRKQALAHGERALELLQELDFETSISAGTTYVNVATARQAFGDAEGALALFEKARQIYESAPQTNAQLLGGLYNNMGLALTAAARYDEALARYEQALAVMERVPHGAPERAITCLNMADTVAAQLGAEAGEARVAALLERAQALLEDEAAPRDGYYAFVCEKCAPVFSYYGWFLAAEELKRTAENIYART